MTGPFDTAALRQASEMPWPKEFREQSRLWTQNSSDLAAAADYIDELEQRVAFLVAEAHGWQPKLQAAETERDRIRNAAEWMIANRGHRGEAHAWKLLAAALAKEDTDD